MKTILVASVVAVLPTSAHADDTMFGLGVTVGGDPKLLHGAVTAEVARELAENTYVRGAAALGQSFDAEGAGDFLQVTAGIERDGDRWSVVCPFIGGELGYRHATWSGDDMDEDHSNVLADVRGGLGIGNESLRVRLSLEAGFVPGEGPTLAVALGIVAIR
jgi:hypothetical protein